MISISTKTGDDGSSALANGTRLLKGHQVFAVIGALDELNSWLGLIVTMFDESHQLHQKFLTDLQETLFYIGAEIAESPKARLKKSALSKLEKQADRLQTNMAEGWHTTFLLPGGTPLGAYLDIARTVCRRCERESWRYHHSHRQISPLILQYLNRLSDYLYLLRCWINHQQMYHEKQFIAK